MSCEHEHIWVACPDLCGGTECAHCHISGPDLEELEK